ncbi:MAG: macro domain-containing protein [Cyanobacteria bacterium P01_E01_bin.34]
MPHSRIQLIKGDITTLEVDAIVTAANESLLGGGGVDGAIHSAAGPGLFAECRTIGICPEGEARITGGYLLPARYIIHTVGPVWEGGAYDELKTLGTCYVASLQLAVDNAITSIAFPCIATGSYAVPKVRACDVAVSAVVQWLDLHEQPSKIIFCCFEDEDYQIYSERHAIGHC